MRNSDYKKTFGKIIIVIISISLNINHCFAQFIDNFNENIQLDEKALNGWNYFTGDGSATMSLSKKANSMIIKVDATNDQRSIWWAIIKRNVTKYLDLKKLSQPNYEIRIEARVKLSHAPRRVNLSVNTQRTTNYDSNLMEFDILDTTNFHIISFTTKDFDAVPGDLVNAQLALIDWGLSKYEVELDYFMVDVVNTKTALPDQGIQVPYRPAIANVDTFSEHVAVSNDAMINPMYPDYNFNAWYSTYDQNKVDIITVSDKQYIILKWELSAYKGKKVKSSGLLSIVTHSVQRSSDFNKDFGMIRVSEIIGGDTLWDQTKVSYNSFCQNLPLSQSINTQMIIDVEPKETPGSVNYITISQPVLQRMVDGKTNGIAILPLGAVQSSFFASECKSNKPGIKLHFNLK